MSNWSADTWIAVVALLISIAGTGCAGIAFYFRTTAKGEIDAAIAAAKQDTDRSIVELSARLDRARTSAIENDRRIVAIETSLKQLPSKDDVHRLEVSLKELAGLIGAQNVEIGYLASQSRSNGAKLDRIEQQRLHEALNGEAG